MTRHILMPSKRNLVASIWDKEKLPGSAKAQLIVDNSTLPQPWIVKSINSPQGMFVPGDQAAFNDYVGARLAEAAGFTVGEAAVMNIDNEFLDDYPHLRTAAYGSFTPGEHFAVKYYPGSETLKGFDSPLLRADLRAKCINPYTANQVVAFDSATANWDRAIPAGGLGGENPANLLFRPPSAGTGLEMTLIDHGYCFGARWDSHSPPAYPHSLGAWPDDIFGMFKALALIDFYDQGDIANQLAKLQSLTVGDVNLIIQEVPTSWLGFTNSQELALFVSTLTSRIAGYARIITAKYSSVYADALVKV